MLKKYSMNVRRTRARAVRAAYQANNPGEPVSKPVHADPLGPHRIAAAVAKAQAKADQPAARSLYDTTFND
ncbi:hypothetical protein [Phenylobacterium sp.]|uniref:hypothetical protein n=1 Tax=Phenylobacterium sp. TaxID=1871053 RepID=UPI003D277F08